MALGIYAIDTQLPRKQYASLQEIFHLLTEGDGFEKLKDLPDSVGTLKIHTKGALPHFGIRSKNVALNPSKLTASREITALMSEDKVPKQFCFPDVINMFARVLSSSLADLMHFGMAHLVDNPTEAWHGLRWASTIRITSNDFAYYPDTENADGKSDLIFLGDMIMCKCGLVKCLTCRPEIEQEQKFHHGQV